VIGEVSPGKVTPYSDGCCGVLERFIHPIRFVIAEHGELQPVEASVNVVPLDTSALSLVTEENSQNACHVSMVRDGSVPLLYVPLEAAVA
jgi:hypothetical protein